MAATAASRAAALSLPCPGRRACRYRATRLDPPPRPGADPVVRAIAARLVRAQQRQPRQQVRAESHGWPRCPRCDGAAIGACCSASSTPAMLAWRIQGMSASATSTARGVPQASKCRAAVARLVPMPSPAGSASITRQSSARSSAASAALPGRTTATTLSTAARSRRALATAARALWQDASSLSAPGRCAAWREPCPPPAGCRHLGTPGRGEH